ncbi:MAG: hypothetical protein MJZ81_10750 [Bacteroidales bacterium]|nr:hypothetical protein [Bacteroidales bacterium]
MFKFDIYDEDGYYTTITGDDIEDVMDAMKHDLAFHTELYSGEVTIKGGKVEEGADQ